MGTLLNELDDLLSELDNLEDPRASKTNSRKNTDAVSVGKPKDELGILK